MVAGIFHSGSGIGDQLMRYITARTLALDKGYEFGMVNPENFKGKEFMNLDMGVVTSPSSASMSKFEEKKIMLGDLDITQYDPEINFVEDNTVIDGNFEDIKYWGHRLSEIRQWLKVEPLEVLDNTWVMNIRGGEYRTVPELILPNEYWYEISHNKFIDIHTDDPEYAKEIFPSIVPIKDIGANWRALRYAKQAIISNSAFAIIPRLLVHLDNPDAVTIAPRYWARRNIGIWARPACYYPKFTYI